MIYCDEKYYSKFPIHLRQQTRMSTAMRTTSNYCFCFGSIDLQFNRIRPKLFVQCFWFLFHCSSPFGRHPVIQWYQFIGTHWLVKQPWPDWLSNEQPQRHTVRIGAHWTPSLHDADAETARPPINHHAEYISKIDRHETRIMISPLAPTYQHQRRRHIGILAQCPIYIQNAGFLLVCYTRSVIKLNFFQIKSIKWNFPAGSVWSVRKSDVSDAIYSIVALQLHAYAK